MKKSESINMHTLKNTIIIIGYNIFMMFYQLLPSFLSGIISALLAVYIFFFYNSRTNKLQTLFCMMIVFLPTSFVSIIGTSYAELPLSWFTLINIILFIIIIITGTIDRKYLLIFIFFIAFCSISLLNVYSIVDASKQILTIMLFIFCFFVGEYIKSYYSEIYMKNIKFLYILSTIAFCFQVLIQKVYIDSTGIKIGHYIIMGLGRVTYGGLMNDYSFATLYLATGAMILLNLYFDERAIKFYSMILLEILLIITILIINSRTGLYVFMVIASFYLIKNTFKGNKKAILLVIVMCISLPFIFRYLIENRNGQALFDSSGRIINYKEALEIFYSNYLIGKGFGLENLYKATGIGVPHNFFIQYLVQCGIIGTILIFSNILILFKNSIDKNNNMRWSLYIVLLGAMFIPDIVSSRFLGVIVIMTIINSYNRKEVINVEKI